MRISKRRQAFEKGYVAGWSEEIFIVTNGIPSTPVTYAIKDLAGQAIKGRFYESELQLIVKEHNVYDVEKVLKTRRRNEKVEYYVKWRGYLENFNSWPDSRSVNSERWKICGTKFPKQEVIYFCQVFIVYIVLISSIVNPCISDRNNCLWSSLVNGSVGYLPPNPSIKRKENDVVSPDHSIQ